MSIDTAKQKLFATLVDKAIIASRQINSLLETEFDALSGNKPEVLQSLIEEKKQHLISLSQVMAEQESLLYSMQLSNDAEGVKILYANIPSDHEWIKNWSKLKKLAQTMADNNLRNGIMLQQRTDSTRAALSILTGRNQEQASTYQYGGRTNNTHESKILAYA